MTEGKTPMPTNTDKPKKTIERMPPRPLYREAARVVKAKAKGKPAKTAKNDINTARAAALIARG